MAVQTNHKENPFTYETEYKLLEQIIKLLAESGENKFLRYVKRS